MPAELDVYRDWLGIRETRRPLDYYTLLRLKTFEDDPVRIRQHYRKLNAHVRKFAAGDFSEQSQDLLNELAKAMLCLTDARRKAEYDASLGRADAGVGKRRTVEQILLLRKVIDQEQLEKARRYAEAVGLEMHDALLQQKLARPEVVMQVYAESLGLPYIDLADVGVDPVLAPRVPAILARQHSCAPVMVDDGQALMASPQPLSPDVEDELRLRLGMPVRTVLCTTAGINAAIAEYYSREAAAAEMAAGGGHAPAKPAAASADGGPPDEGAAANARAEQRRRAMMALMAFNLTFVATMIYQFVFRMPPPTMLPALGTALVLAAPVALTVFAGLTLTGK